MREHVLAVERSARVLVEGDLASAREVWFVLHGYAQAAHEMLSACASLADEQRALVAPEALSRFYRRGSSGPIGASWMTRELRDEEVRDYVRYLDQVAAWVARSTETPVRVALGFSQGAATAWRWASLGQTNFDAVIGWGGGFPPDLELANARERLARAQLLTVRGREDSYHTAEWLERDVAKAAEQALTLHVLEFDGGHRLEPSTLLAAAARTRRDEPDPGR